VVNAKKRHRRKIVSFSGPGEDIAMAKTSKKKSNTASKKQQRKAANDEAPIPPGDNEQEGSEVDRISTVDFDRFVRVYAGVKQGKGLAEAADEERLGGRGDRIVERIERWIFPPGDMRQLVTRNSGGSGFPNKHGDMVFNLLSEFLTKKLELRSDPIFRSEGINIGATESAVHFSLPWILSRCKFIEEQATTSFDISQGSMPTILRNLRSGRIRIGFGRGEKTGSKIVQYWLCSVPRALIFPKTHSFNDLKKSESSAKEALDQLKHETVLMRSDDLTPHFEKERLVPPPDITSGKRILLPSVAHIYRWCKQGFGVGLGYADWMPPGSDGVLDFLSLKSIAGFPDAELFLYLRSDWTNRLSKTEKLFVRKVLEVFPNEWPEDRINQLMNGPARTNG
jgi:hypothetical protein